MRLKSLIGVILSLLLLTSVTVDSLAVGDSYGEDKHGGGPFGEDSHSGGPFGEDSNVGDSYDEDPYNGVGGAGVIPAGEFLDIRIYSRNGEPIQDFFGNEGKDFYPGDSRVFTVRLINSGARQATFYMIAAARTINGYAPGQSGSLNQSDSLNTDYLSDSFDLGAGKSTNLEPFFPGKKAGVDALLEAMHITMAQITVGDASTPFFAGSLGGTPDATGEYGPYGTTRFQLGSLVAGETRVIEVRLALDPTYGNEIMDALASVDWTFYAIGNNSNPATSYPPLTPTSPAGEIPETAVKEDIPETPPSPVTPLKIPITEPNANSEDDITLIVPRATLPKTGGLTNFSTAAALAVLLILILLLIIAVKERKTRRLLRRMADEDENKATEEPCPLI
jgi:hypothetical protein